MLLIASALAQPGPAFAEQDMTAAKPGLTVADAQLQSSDAPSNTSSGTPSNTSSGTPSGTLSYTPLQAQAENTLASVNGRNWMSKLPDHIPVSSISIPGTHDAATMWTKIPGGLSAVQDQPIGEWSYSYVNVFGNKSTEHFDGQLNSGVRYFDLRLSVKTADDTEDEEDVGKLYLLHGFHYNEAQLLTDDYALAPADYKTLFLDGDGEDCNGDGLEDGVWPWFEDFLSRNPTETLIVEFSDEDDGKKAEAYEFFKEKALEAGSRVWKGTGVPTLGEARGRIILFSNLGASYSRDRFKLNDGRYWAFPVRWGSGSENHGVEKCGEYDDIELWGQNTYEGIYAKAKQNYVLNGIAYETEGGGMYARSAAIRDAAIKNGRHAWIANFTSGNSPMRKGLRHMLITPRDYHAQTVKNGLMSVYWLKDDYLQGYWQNQSTTGVFTGILPMDFVNADLARFVYRINFYSYGPPEYTWHFTDDLDNMSKTTCTATRYVMGDRSKSQTVESAGLHEFAYTKTPSCAEPGAIRYVAYFPAEAPWALPATATQDVPALGHHYEYASGNGTETITYKCTRCNEEVALTLNAKPRQYYDTSTYYPLHDCTLGNVDAFNAAMGTDLYLNNVKLYKNGSEIEEAKDAGAYTARVYVDETHYVECAFEITPQVINLPVDDFIKEYGQPDPDFTANLPVPDEVRDNISVTREPGENVGTYKLTVNLSGNPNYTLKTMTSIQWDDGRKYPQLTIVKRRIKVSRIAVYDKVYDGTTAATLKPGAAKFSYVDTEEEFTDPNLDISVPCRFVHHNINENASFTITDLDELKLVGLNANNYVIRNKYTDIVNNGTATISQRPVKVWALAQSVEEGDSIVDHGAEYAIATGTEAEESGLAEGDELSSVSFRADRPTGDTITSITPSDARIEHSSGEDATHNYRIEYGEGIAYVRKIDSTTPLANTGLTYDGAEHELVICNDANVRYSLDGINWSPDIPKAKDAGSHMVYWRIGDSEETAVVCTEIARKPVQVVPDSTASKTYGDPDPTTIELHPLPNALPLDGHKLSGVSRMPGENVGTYRYDTSGIKVLDSNNGNADVTSNYNISVVDEERVFTINPRPVFAFVSSITAENKVYDGTATAVVEASGATIVGALDVDRLTVSATGQFSDKSAGENKTVTLGELTLNGENASNYKLENTSQHVETTATIVPKPIGVSGIIVGNEGAKVYDGANTIPLNVSGATFDKIDGDDVSVSETGTLANPDVGTNKNVTLQLTGADKDNYEIIVTGPNTRYTAQVTPRPVNVAGITAENKVYDGTTEATLNFSSATLDGVLDADTDDVSILEAETTGEFENANAGENKTVAISPALEGEEASNYTLSSDASQWTTTASITKRPLAITADDQILEVGQEAQQGPEYAHVDAISDSPENPLPAQGLVDGQYLGGITLTADNAAGTVTPGQAKIYADDDAADTPVDYSANYDITYTSGAFKPSQFVTLPEGEFLEFDGTAHALATPGEAVVGRKMQYYVEPISDIEEDAAGEGGGDSAGDTDGSVGEAANGDADGGTGGGSGDQPATDEQQTEWMDGLAWQDSIPTAKDAGLYCVIYRAVDETGSALADYDFGSTLAYIAPKTVNVTWSSTSFTYNGSPQAPTAELTGFVGNDAFAATVVGAQTNAGTYIATATAPLSANYELDNKSCSTTFTIAKAKSAVSIKAQSRYYTGKKLAYTGAVTKSGSTGAVKVALYKDKACKKVAKPKNVGTYYAKATLAADANHLGAASSVVKFTIKKAANKLVVKPAKAKRKVSKQKRTVIAKKKAFKVRANKSKGKLTFTKLSGNKKIRISKNGKVTIAKGLKKGRTYVAKVKVTSKATKSYKRKSVTVKLRFKAA